MTSRSWKSAISGPWSTAADWSPGAVPNSMSDAVTIAASGSYIVSVATGLDFAVGSLTIGSAATVSVLGTLGVGALSGGDLVIGARGLLQASGVLAGTLVDNGLIATTGATTITGAVSGSGNILVASGTTLELASAMADHVVFGGTNAELLLAAPASFSAVINGFEQTDTIALAGVQATGVRVVGDSLEVLSGSAIVDTLALPADYSAAKFSVVEANNTAFIGETGITYTTEGETWATSTITWSFAATTYAEDATNGIGFTNYVSQTADQALIEQALSEWSSVTGLSFVEVADTSNAAAAAADIRIGWAQFTGGEIGEADYSFSGTTFDNDVVVRLEDPAATPITTVGTTATYSGTQSSLFQVALHEIGHAIGLDHTSDSAAIMFPTATASNRQLDASDIAAAQGLYAADVACFAAGTRIRTAAGEMAVECLVPGDRVVSALTGALVPVVWTGHRLVDCRLHPRPRRVWPVRVRAGAFGQGRPVRDLLLSPDHAVCTGGVLIPVRYLVDGVAVCQEKVPEIVYWHVETAAHDVVFADGLSAETYLDTGNRACFDDTKVRHPDFMARTWDAACLELQCSGPAVSRARRTLANRIAAFVSLNGVPLRPARVVGALARYLPGPGNLAIRHAPRTEVLLNGLIVQQRNHSLRRPSVLEILRLYG